MFTDPRKTVKDLLQVGAICRAAYMGGSTVAKLLKPVFPGGIWQHSNKNAYALAADDGRRNRVIVVRGSDDRADWIGNFRFGRHATPAAGDGNGRYVHRGFWDHLGLLWTFIYEHATVADRRIILAGHSLGGATAVAAGYRMLQSGDDVDAVVTFGQPRVLSPQAAREFQTSTRITRVVNAGDWVDNLPPRFGRSPFEHCGAVVHLSRTGQIATEAPTIRSQIWGQLKQLVQRGEPLDHSMTEYTRRLKIAAGGAK